MPEAAFVGQSFVMVGGATYVDVWFDVPPTEPAAHMWAAGDWVVARIFYSIVADAVLCFEVESKLADDADQHRQQ